RMRRSDGGAEVGGAEGRRAEGYTEIAEEARRSRGRAGGSDHSLSSFSFSFSGSGAGELGHKRHRRRRSWVLQGSASLWPRLVGAGLWRRILTQRRKDAE